jgi:hypothetical protein
VFKELQSTKDGVSIKTLKTPRLEAHRLFRLHDNAPLTLYTCCMHMLEYSPLAIERFPIPSLQPTGLAAVAVVVAAVAVAVAAAAVAAAAVAAVAGDSDTHSTP